MEIFDVVCFCSLFAKPIKLQFDKFLQIFQNGSGGIENVLTAFLKKSKLYPLQ